MSFPKNIGLLNLLALMSVAYSGMANAQPAEIGTKDKVLEGVREVLDHELANPKQSSNRNILNLTLPECLIDDELLENLFDLLEEYGTKDRTWLCINGTHYSRDAKDAFLFAFHDRLKSITGGRSGLVDIHAGFCSSIELTFQDISDIRNWIKLYNTGIERLTLNGLTIVL